jgi:hypothetical protein
LSVRRHEDGTILLEGRCPVEDAEPLLQLLQETPPARCDWTRCSHLHSAVAQVILAARPNLVGPCGDPWIEQWVASILPGNGLTRAPAGAVTLPATI